MISGLLEILFTHIVFVPLPLAALLIIKASSFLFSPLMFITGLASSLAGL